MGQRYEIDFDKELHSLEIHAERIKRPGLSHLVKKVYIPKFQVKRFAPFIYAGENDRNYRQLRHYQTTSLRQDAHD